MISTNIIISRVVLLSLLLISGISISVISIIFVTHLINSVCACVCVCAEHPGGPVDQLHRAEHRPAAVQELRLTAGPAFGPAGGSRHDNHQRAARFGQPARALLRRRLHHVRAERGGQAQDQPGGGRGDAAGRLAGPHPGQLVGPHRGARLQQPAGAAGQQEGVGRLHLRGLGRRSAPPAGRSSSLLQQPPEVRRLWRNGQVLQQQRLGTQQELRLGEGERAWYRDSHLVRVGRVGFGGGGGVEGVWMKDWKLTTVT